MSCKLSKIANRRFISTNRTPNLYKVGVVGASGGIGQPLSLLLKLSPLVTELALHDVVHTPGVAADLSHINTQSKVVHTKGADQLPKSIQGCRLIICPAGQPRKPGMTRDDLFDSNAKSVKDVATAAAEAAPDAQLLIITNPINSLIPIACEIYKGKKKNEMNIFGITSLDMVRASTFVASLKKLDPTKLSIPVVGGHAGKTIIPLLSQSNPKVSFTDKEVDDLTIKIQDAGTEVVKAKAGAGSATLSTAYAAFRTAEKFLKAFGGDGNQVECCYVRQNFANLKYFSTPLQLGPKGIAKNLGMPANITEYEKKAIDGAISELQKAIKKGEEYILKH